MKDYNKIIEDLLKTDSSIKSDISSDLENTKKYNNTKSYMRLLCNGFNQQSTKFRPDEVVTNINSYISKKDKLDRILYSEISNYIFELTTEKRGTFLTNLEHLLLYVLDENNSVKADTRKMVIKIYDHVQLASHQIENANNIFNNSIVDAKSKLNDEIKGIEKEYITILGIFASIVLTFVGGITFTTSVLQNINNVSIFRLILIVDLIGAVLVNVIYLMISFIFRINDKEKENNRQFIKTVNYLLFGIAVVVVLSWFINIIDLQKYISNFFIWTSKKR